MPALISVYPVKSLTFWVCKHLTLQQAEACLKYINGETLDLTCVYINKVHLCAEIL